MNKIAIYTSIFGDYDNLLEPRWNDDKVDYICFTDQNFKSDIWNIKKAMSIFDSNNRNAKRFKILPHRYLEDYKYSIWIDGNIIVKNNVIKLIEKYLTNDIHHAAFNHNDNKLDPRNCIYEEYNAIMYHGNKLGRYKDNPEIMTKQINKYIKEGYPKNNGLTTNMVLIREHNTKDCKKVMDDWWKEIVYHSKRDQLSFNYVAWKNDYKFNYINKDSRDNKWFKQVEHK